MDVTAKKSAEVDPAETEEEEAVVYVVSVELAGKNVVGVDEIAIDELVCGVEH